MEKDYFVYLDIPDNTDDIFTLNDYRIICEAMGRAQLYFDGEMIQIGISSAGDINISERLFDLIKRIVDDSNRPENRPPIALLTKSGNYPYSCVAYALSHWRGAPSFYVINHYIDSAYNLNGAVPTNQLGVVMNHFFQDGFMGYSTSNLPDDMEWAVDRTIGVCYSDEYGWGHMVNIAGRSGDFFTIRDFSNDTIGFRIIHKSLLLYVYENLSPVDTLELL